MKKRYRTCSYLEIIESYSAIILKFQEGKIDTKGFSTVSVSTGTPESGNKMLT